nr:hypothetical protein [Pseudomonas veronii]
MKALGLVIPTITPAASGDFLLDGCSAETGLAAFEATRYPMPMNSKAIAPSILIADKAKLDFNISGPSPNEIIIATINMPIALPITPRNA